MGELPRLVEDRMSESPPTVGYEPRSARAKPIRRWWLLVGSTFVVLVFSFVLLSIWADRQRSASSPRNSDFSIRGSPKEFFSQLMTSSQRCITVASIQGIWVQESDLLWLRDFIDNPQPCPSVAGAWSSQIPAGRSTLSRESLYLIESIRKRRYPPTLSSDRFDPADTRRWLSERQSANR